MKHRIVIAGGTGFLGNLLIKYFEQRNDVQIVILTRGKAVSPGKIIYVNWDAKNLGSWTEVLEGSTAFINLVGRSVNCRYTKKNKQDIIQSRVNATLVIGKAIQQAQMPPEVWINMGSTAIFGNGSDVIKNEQSAMGAGFSAEVCKQSEQAFFRTITPFTRKVFLRMGMVFQKNNGFLASFANLVKAGLGGTIGSGNQYISWIHEKDFANVIYAALVNPNYKGIIHCTSPYPVTNEHFMKTLRGSLKKAYGLPNPSLLVKVGAFFVKTEAELVLSGRRVVPDVLKEKHFTFQYPHIEDALHHLLEDA